MLKEPTIEKSFISHLLEVSPDLNIKSISLFLLVLSLIHFVTLSVYSVLMDKWRAAPLFHMFLTVILVYSLYLYFDNYHKLYPYKESPLILLFAQFIVPLLYIVQSKKRDIINPDDEIGYQSQVKDLISVIDNESTKTIALIGDNGIGKTFVANKAKTLLSKKNYEIISFNSYYYYEIAEMIDMLFKDIYNTMRRNEPNPSVKSIKFYLEPIVASIKSFNSITKIAEPIYSLFYKKLSTCERINRISEILSTSEKKYVIFIDDVDRCTQEAKKLLYSTLLIFRDIDRLNFVVCATVDDILNSSLKTKSELYMERYIDYKIVIPNLTDQRWKKYFLSRIEMINGHAYDENIKRNLQELINKDEYSHILQQVLKTPRKIKLFANELEQALSKHSKYVNFEEIVWLTSLKCSNLVYFTSIPSKKQKLLSGKLNKSSIEFIMSDEQYENYIKDLSNDEELKEGEAVIVKKVFSITGKNFDLERYENTVKISPIFDLFFHSEVAETDLIEQDIIIQIKKIVLAKSFEVEASNNPDQSLEKLYNLAETDLVRTYLNTLISSRYYDFAFVNTLIIFKAQNIKIFERKSTDLAIVGTGLFYKFASLANSYLNENSNKDLEYSEKHFVAWVCELLSSKEILPHVKALFVFYTSINDTSRRLITLNSESIVNIKDAYRDWFETEIIAKDKNIFDGSTYESLQLVFRYLDSYERGSNELQEYLSKLLADSNTLLLFLNELGFPSSKRTHYSTISKLLSDNKLKQVASQHSASKVKVISEWVDFIKDIVQ